MNIITITGNLGKDIAIKAMPSGEQVGEFSVADSQGKDKPAIWWYCSMFGEKRLNALSQYLCKGQQVTVIGNVTEREWTDQNGVVQKRLSVRVVDLALQGGKPQQSQQSQPTARRPSVQPKPRAPAGNVFDDMDNDIPF